MCFGNHLGIEEKASEKDYLAKRLRQWLFIKRRENTAVRQDVFLTCGALRENEVKRQRKESSHTQKI